MTSRPTLESPELDPVWDAVRRRLERSGPESRGRVRLVGMTSRGRYLLEALVGTPVRTTVELAAVERSLRLLGVGETLPAALAALGHPVSPARAERQAARKLTEAVRAAARYQVDCWPEPWAGAWIDDVIRAGLLSGLDVGEARALVGETRAVLDRLGDVEDREPAGSTGSATPAWPATPVSRTDLAAEVLGSSHALDRGTRVEAAVSRALDQRFPGLARRQRWERAGVHLDLVSAPVLTWNLCARPDSALAPMLDQATRLGVPLHLTQLALRSHPVAVAPGSDVLVVENPRVVEAAAQSSSALSVVTVNGQPSGAVLMLLDQLLAGGARLRYHGDFDAAGLGICARMHRLGLVPWRMDAESYLGALDTAESGGAELPIDRSPAPPTPWDPALQAAFDRHRSVVHEERLLAELLTLGR